MNTKLQIMEAALDLMSEKGFYSVSIRVICKAVGIKESSIYYHYKNKDDILNSITINFEKINQSMAAQFEGTVFDGLTFDIIKKVTLEYARQYLLNDFVVKFCKLLTIQQHSSADFSNLYHKYFFNSPVEFQKQIFKGAAKAKIINNSDSDFVAVSYYSYIFFLYNKYIITHARINENKEQFTREVSEFIENFIFVYGGKGR